MQTGLTNEEVLISRKKYGNNSISITKKNSFLKIFLESLGDPIIRILLIALAIKCVFLMKNFDWYETIGIVIAIFLASFISSISEYGSEKAFISMQEESSKIKCKVKRNNKIIEIDIDDIVKDDIVVLQSGDRVPADGIIIYGDVSLDESLLNGEKKEKYKSINDKIYRGSIIYENECIMKVEEVGFNTEYGHISSSLSEKEQPSPLKLRLLKLAKIISKIGYIGAILVSISYLFSNIVIKNNFDIDLIKETLTNFPLMANYVLYSLTLSVTIIVVAVPEGLPMMITLVLSSNMKRMIKNNVLVRKMHGIETAGSINILFTDKTGTLTKGQLDVIGFTDYNLNFYKSEKELMKSKIYDLVKISTIYNNMSSRIDNKIVGGNITDQSLLKFIESDYILNIPKKNIVNFNSKNKYSSVDIIYKDNKITLIKGASEVILNKCKYYYDINTNKKRILDKKNIEKFINDKSSEGIRIITLAIKENDDSIFLGLYLIKDEVRKDAIEGVKLITNAGISTIMITGDNRETAKQVAIETGIYKDNDIILTSSEFNQMSDFEVKKILSKLKVLSRALPSDKSRLVKIAQEENLVVGMTGDGVNDAIALKNADVGFSMGSGCEVSKEASDIVILDDNFLSIAKAILFGRTIFKSIRKFIIFQLTINICAISLSIIGPFIGVDTPVTVIQMLWINMVMDTLASLAFSYEAPLLEYMKEIPKKKDEPILNKYMINEIIFTGFYSAILCILFLKVPIFKSFFREDINDAYFMTAFFGLFIFIGIFNAFNARTSRINILSNILKNKIFLYVIAFIFIVQLVLIYYGGSLFRTAGLTLKELEIMILMAFTVIPVDMLRKYILRKKGKLTGV